MSTQLHLLPPDQAALLIKKKRFWKRTMWISLALAICFLLLGTGGYVISMTRAFAQLEKSGAADPTALANEISNTIIISLVTLPIATLGFLLFLISLIRCLSLPKLPASSPVK